MKSAIMTVAFLMSALSAMALPLDLKVGESYSKDGAPTLSRGTQNGGQAAGDVTAHYEEMTVRGHVFSLFSGTVTIPASGVMNSGCVVGTCQFLNGIFNPAGSGKIAVILASPLGMTSGTPGGPFFYNFYCGLNVTSSAGTIRNRYLTNVAANSVMIPQVNTALVTSPATTTPGMNVLGIVGGSPAAAAVGAGSYSNVDNVDGRIIVPPGCLLGITSTAAGTTNIMHSELIWEEIPTL